MKKLLLILLVLTACKKEDIKTNNQSKTKLFTHSSNGVFSEVKVNGTVVTPPVEVKTGDVINVRYATQPTTPTTYNLNVYIYLDGVEIGKCTGCFEYINQFNI